MHDPAPGALTDKTPRLRRLAAHLKRDRWPTIATALDRAATRIASGVGSPLPLLLTLSLVQGMLWAWATFGIAEQRIAPAHALTLLGAGLYHPDRDLPIYLVGALTCVLLDALLVALLARPSLRGDSPSGPRAEFVACAVVALLPVVAPDSRPGYLVACVTGLGLVAWRLRVRWRSTPAAVSAQLAPASPPLPAARGPLAHLAAYALPLAILALLVFVPWPRTLLWQAWEGDRFHHFDFYAMAPALAHAHGLRLGTDFYSQYGVGWPMVMGALGRATGAPGYTTFLRLEVLVGCAYFLGLFAFLKAWLRSASWATAGLLLALLLALFIDTGVGPKWLWPSSTVLRYAFDVALFAVLLAHARSGDARLGPLAGSVLALQVLFSSDVGLYLLFAFGVYLVCAARRHRPERPPGSVARFALGAALASVLAAAAGFTLANQGELPGRAFWKGVTEPIVAYSGGIANLPIAGALGGSPGVDLLLLAMLAMYLHGLGAALSACVDRSVSPARSIRAAIAAYGLGTLVLFIGRSHDQNLMHVTLPFCLLLAELALSTARAGLAGAAPRWIGPQHVLSLALVAAICVQGARVDYPNVLDVATGLARATASRPTWTDRAGDVLPADSPDDVAEFRAASEAIRQASDGGRHAVAVIGYNDTAYLAQAGVAPYFRYSPVLASLLFKDQVRDITRRIEDAPPEWIFIAAEPVHMLYGASSVDAVGTILAAMQRDYVRQGRAGHFTVYRKAAPGHSDPAVDRVDAR
ncbi:MAG: hypothetical protein ABJD97_02965 [Betaproteobacteria bacterium]